MILIRTFMFLALVAVSSAYALDLGQDARFGMYGGKQPEPKADPPFDVMSTKWGTRWFPSHVRWAPDDSHLLVSLCHVNQHAYCRIGKYWILENRWELLDLQPQVTYRWPSYSPDGKYIVASAGGCDKDYRCPQQQYALILLAPDAKRTIKLADTIAIHPTFSDDGKKLIYWRSSGATLDVAQFDLTTSKEDLLTTQGWQDGQRGWPYFLPGGKRYVFAGWLPIYASAPLKQDGSLVYDEKGRLVMDHPLRGTKLDPLGPNKNVIRYAANVSDGGHVTRFDLLWTGPGGGEGDGVLDVSRDGQVLYRCSKRCYTEKLAVSTYRANQIVLDTHPRSEQHILMLRPAREDGRDTVAFAFYGMPQDVAISGDAKRLAISEANPRMWHHSRRLGIVTLGDPNPVFIDWPRLELDPAAVQTTMETK